jgi:uncharacterized membrane protein
VSIWGVVVAEDPDGADMAVASLFEEPNHDPVVPSVVQADTSGKSAIAVKQTLRSGSFLFVIAVLVFTLHLMISLIAMVIASKTVWSNCCKRHHSCQAS